MPKDVKQPPDPELSDIRFYNDGESANIHLQQREPRIRQRCPRVPDICSHGLVQWHRRWHD